MNDEKISYRELRTQTEYLKLVAANVVNRFGDSIDSVAFSWLMYQVTGSAALMALIFGLNFIPTVILQPFTGALVENLPKKPVMVWFDVARGLVVALCVVGYQLQALTPGLLIVMTLLISTLEAFRTPAGSAIVPKILDESCYTTGTALNQTACRVTELIGLAAAGGVVAWLGCGGALLIDAATFFISAFIIGLIRLKEPFKRETGVIRSVWGGLLAGFSLLRSKTVLLTIILIGMLMNFTLVPLNAYSAAFVAEVLGGGAEMLSIINLLLIVGMGIGSAITPKLNKLSWRMQLVLFGSLSSVALMLYGASACFATAARYGVVLFASLLLGFSTGVITVVFNAAFMKLVPSEYMARMSGISNAVLCCAMPVGSFACSALAAVIPVWVAILAAGALSAALYLSILKLKNLNLLDEGRNNE